MAILMRCRSSMSDTHLLNSTKSAVLGLDDRGRCDGGGMGSAHVLPQVNNGPVRPEYQSLSCWRHSRLMRVNASIQSHGQRNLIFVSCGRVLLPNDVVQASSLDYCLNYQLSSMSSLRVDDPEGSVGWLVWRCSWCQGGNVINTERQAAPEREPSFAARLLFMSDVAFLLPCSLQFMFERRVVLERSHILNYRTVPTGT
jgi:hypothetical protein